MKPLICLIILKQDSTGILYQYGVSSWSSSRWLFTTDQLVVCLITFTFNSANPSPKTKCLSRALEMDSWQSGSLIWRQLEYTGPEIQSRAHGCPAKPGHASSTEGFSAAGHWGEGAWHLISYHCEFCSCHWHLATEKQSRDDGCCWTQLGFHVTVAVALYQTAPPLIQNDIPLKTSVPVAHYLLQKLRPQKLWSQAVFVIKRDTGCII